MDGAEAIEDPTRELGGLEKTTRPLQAGRLLPFGGLPKKQSGAENVSCMTTTIRESKRSLCRRFENPPHFVPHLKSRGSVTESQPRRKVR